MATAYITEQAVERGAIALWRDSYEEGMGEAPMSAWWPERVENPDAYRRQARVVLEAAHANLGARISPGAVTRG